MMKASLSLLLITAKVLKEEGNVHFREGEVVLAGARYDRGLKFLCLVLPRNQDKCALLWNLAIALELNLAACALKVVIMIKLRSYAR
ncbi:Peptidyl-prolyl cis-trans isomerase FKBP65 [Bienertia sinuspersici]